MVIAAAGFFLEATWPLSLVLGTVGALAVLLAGGALQSRQSAPAAWLSRIAGWVLGFASLGLWLVVPMVALAGAAAWCVACVASIASLFGAASRKVAALTLAVLVADAALFVWFYGQMMLVTDFAVEPFVAPNATAFALLWTLLLLRGGSGKVLV